MNHNCYSCRIGRKKSVIFGLVIAFIASAISVSIPANKISGKFDKFYGHFTGGLASRDIE